jgi:O-succinylbenzoate synthase
MKITSARVFRYELPLAASLRVKSESRAARSGLLLKLESDTTQGWGEAAPLHGLSIESQDDAAEYLSDVSRELQGLNLGSELPPQSFFDEGLAEAPPSARFAVELACFNLMAAGRNVPLRRLVADDAADRILINALLSGSRDDVLAAARSAAAAGYRCVKLKVGRAPAADDAALVSEVRSILGNDVAIRLDANRAWKLDEALAFGKCLAVPVEYIEEPLRNPVQIPTFAAETGLPVALDETLSDMPWSIWTEFAGVTALVLKPTMLGGLYRAKRIGLHAAAREQSAVVSASFESGVGILGLCELAAAIEGDDVAAGLDTYRWLDGDVLAERPTLGPVVDLAGLRASGHAVDESKLTELRRG